MIKFSFLIFGFVAVFRFADSNSKIKLLIPLYNFPDENDRTWQGVANVTSKVDVVSIINPEDGPGPKQVDPDYINALKNLKKSNTKSTGSFMIGYVRTGIGKRSMTDVQNDVLRYYSWPLEYRVSGIFFDEVSDDPKLVSYYQQIYAFAKSTFKDQNLPVFTNPGVTFPKVYFCSAYDQNNNCVGKRATDTGVTFESYYSDWKAYKLDTYMKSLNRSQLAVLIHTCATKEEMKLAINQAVSANVGYVFVTDDVMDDPWDTLPSYFNEEVAYIASFGQA